MGQTVTPYQQLGNKAYPLVYAADVVVPGTPANVPNQCLPNSLSADKVRSKIVVCLRGTGLRVVKGQDVKRAGGAAIVLGNTPAYGIEVPVDAHVFPGTAVSMADVNTILNYINSSAKPTATLDSSRIVVDVRPSLVMAQFSSRGPNVVEPNILKPDVTPPGLNILATWSEAPSPTKLDGDNRVVKYNIVPGTSMSCPHVSATAVFLKSAHPDWSSAAIRSAIMTTATISNAEAGPIMDAEGSVAGPMDYGLGHIGPSTRWTRPSCTTRRTRTTSSSRARAAERSSTTRSRVRRARRPRTSSTTLAGRPRPQRLGHIAPDGDQRRPRRGPLQRRRGRAHGRLGEGLAEEPQLRANGREEGLQDKDRSETGEKNLCKKKCYVLLGMHR